MDVTSYLLGKKSGGGSEINNQNKDVTITENGTTSVSADAGYTGLGTVGITTNVSSSIDDYFNTEVTNDIRSDYVLNFLKKSPKITLANNVRNCYEMFKGWPFKTIDLSEFDTSNVNLNMSNMFQQSQIETLDLSNFDTRNVTQMVAMFQSCNRLTSIDFSNWNTSNINNMSSMFSYMGSIQTIDITDFDTSNVTDMNNMFASDRSLVTLRTNANCESCSNFTSIFDWTSNLTNLSGFYNIGKAYPTTATANTSQYSFSVVSCTKLTHDSLIDIIDGLYDIASAGVATQQLILGTANINKLTSAEIAIATNKGWAVS